MHATNRRQFDEHPDLGLLEAARTGEADKAVRRHVRACAKCRKDLQELEMLQKAFADATAPVVPVPFEIDAAVLDCIAERAGLARAASRPRLVRLRRLAPVAALLLMALVAWMFAEAMNRRPLSSPTPRHSIDLTRFAPGDIDHSGRIDIVDAYHMARRLRMANVAPEGWDLNGDGAVDDADVMLVARKAVSLSREDS